MNSVEGFQELLNSVAFPETPEERDEAEKAIVAFRDSVAELLVMKRMAYDKKLDEFMSIDTDAASMAPEDVVRLFTNQGEMSEISTTILQLEEIVGMEYDGSRPFGFKQYMEYTAKKKKEQA